jgi:integrase
MERYRLPALVLDATGMRIGELEALTWGDVDEPRERWRVSGTVAKTGRPRWVPVPHALFEAVTSAPPPPTHSAGHARWREHAPAGEAYASSV